MTPLMKWISLSALLVIILVIPFYTWLEPSQQSALLEAYQRDAVLSATDLYAEGCVVCHGSTGEGIGVNPGLNNDTVRSMPETELFKTIARGRTNTLMAAWAVEEGGVFSNAQVNDLVTLIQNANWEFVELRVAELGLTPPEVIELEVTETMLASLVALPDGESLGSGLSIYAENCAACHNANGSGTLIAPALNSEELRGTASDELIQLVNNGVPGTLMAGWQNTLTPDQISAVVELIYRWPEMVQAGVEFPEAAVAAFPNSPEVIADGNYLFHIACKSCHGVEAYGSPMAPALNNEIFLSETPDAAIYQIIAGGVSQTMMPAWGSRLTDYEIQSLVAYLRSLEVSASPIVPPILTP